MTSVNLTTVKSNNEIMAESLLNVQNVELKDTSFAERTSHLAPELMFGLPLTSAIVTAPYWGKPLLKPYKAFSEMRKNKSTYSDAWKGLTAQSKADKLSRAYLTENTSFSQGRKNVSNYNKISAWNNAFPKYDTTKKLSELSGKELVNYNKNLCYKEAQKLIEEAKSQKLTGKRLQVYVRKISEAIAKGDAKVHELKLAEQPKSIAGKAGQWIKNKIGFNDLKSNLLKTTKGASALRMASHGLKGMGIFAIIGALTEIPNLISAREVDKVEKAQGRNSNYLGRQVVKSTVKVGSGILGFAAGSAAAGAVAGSIFPVIGNIAGAIIGFAGGCIGAMLTGYVADKAVGEHTAAQEYAMNVNRDNQEKANLVAKEADTNTETQNQLLAALYEKIQKGEITDKDVISAFEDQLQKRNSNQPTDISQQPNNYYQNTSNSDYSDVLYQLRDIQRQCLNYAA